MEIVWNIPCGEKMLDRLEELHEVLDHCPESKFAPIWQCEIERIKRKIQEGLV